MGEADREFEQRQRVAARLRQEPLADARGESGEPVDEERSGVGLVEWLEVVLGESGRVEEGLQSASERGHEPDSGASGPPSDERQHGRAGAVDPWQVVDDDEDRASGGGSNEQLERGVRRQQLVRRGPLTQTEGHRERFGVGRPQAIDAIEEWAQELVQPGEADVGLELRTGRPQEPCAGTPRIGGDHVEQRGLADPGLARDQHGPAFPRRAVDERGEPLNVLLLPDELA